MSACNQCMDCAGLGGLCTLVACHCHFDEALGERDAAYGMTFTEWLEATGRSDSASRYSLREAWRAGEDPELYRDDAPSVEET